MTHLTLPKEFGDLIGGFAENCLNDRPDDIIEYAAEYFERVQLNRRPYKIYGSMELNVEPTPPSTIISNSTSTNSSTLSLTQPVDQAEDDVTIPKSTAQDKYREDFLYLMNLLREIPRFSTVDDVILKDIVDMMYPITVSAGDVVFDEDDPRNNIYVIQQGIFNVIMINRDTCQEEILYVYANQGNFGQRFVRQDCLLPAFVRAVTNGVLWVIEGRVIYKIIAGLKKSAKSIAN